MVIRLSVRRWLDLDAFADGITLPLLRIMTTVRILTTAGWSHPRHGIIDTGNPVTLIPRRVWSNGSIDLLTATSRPVYGLGATEASALRGRLGRVLLSLEDDEGLSPTLPVTAYLLDDNRAPLLLGCEGVLTRAILRTNLAALEASLEF